MAETKRPEGRGIECPACGCQHCPVLYTRHFAENKTRRRRECRACGKEFTTLEQAQIKAVPPKMDMSF